jgi:hypothetical protein
MEIMRRRYKFALGLVGISAMVVGIGLWRAARDPLRVLQPFEKSVERTYLRHGLVHKRQTVHKEIRVVNYLGIDPDRVLAAYQRAYRPGSAWLWDKAKFSHGPVYVAVPISRDSMYSWISLAPRRDGVDVTTVRELSTAEVVWVKLRHIGREPFTEGPTIIP